jgi:hypothetical protein
MRSNCGRLIENTHQDVLREIGVCKEKYNFGGQGLGDSAEQKLVWENYGTTYKMDFALINKGCCQNIESYYNGPFIVLYNSTYLLFALQIVVVVMSSCFLAGKRLSGANETVDGQSEATLSDTNVVMPERPEFSEVSFWKIFFKVLLVSVLIAGLFFGIVMATRKNRSGVNKNLTEFVANLNANKLDDPRIQTGLPASQRTTQAEDKTIRDDPENETLEIVVAGKVHNHKNCSNLRVVSTLKNGALLDKSALGQDCKFNIQIANSKSAKIFNKYGVLLESVPYIQEIKAELKASHASRHNRLPKNFRQSTVFTKTWDEELDNKGGQVNCREHHSLRVFENSKKISDITRERDCKTELLQEYNSID